MARPKTRATRGRGDAIAAVAVVAVFVLAGLGFALMETPPREEFLVTVVVDASPTNAPDRCEDIGRILSMALERSVGENLTFVAFATTDSSRGNGLARLGQFRQEVGALSLGTTSSAAEVALEERTRAARAVAQMCASLEGRLESPIFRAAELALSDLRGMGCGAQDGPVCSLIIRTDGIEEADPVILAALRGREQPDRVARLSAPGVDVQVCGVAQVQLRKGSVTYPFAKIRAAWGPELGPDGEQSVVGTCASTAQPLTLPVGDSSMGGVR